ncbi:hypothetical protein Cfor_00047 [Coptotermes formosanus]|uniref:Uncharacterized protein n=1 Tax=Coptotermes formosanus TaxID=36987 RepID=A0A6L2PKZ7_COPFO|nr:hypothetical protein Cfor_00047 [Coptotermes formosanus]
MQNISPPCRTVEDVRTRQSYSAMKRVLIQDDDEDLFSVPLQPFVYHYYKENSKEIRRMVKRQGAGFWIQFVTSFRSFVSNSVLDRTGGCESYEEAFIDMLKILTTENSFTEFISLIESLKTLHVLLGSQYGKCLFHSTVIKLREHNRTSSPLHTFPIYSRFVGAVVVLYQRWKHALRIRAGTPPAKWTPPSHWSQQNGHGPRLYECYLYDRWGDTLYRVIHVDKEVMKFFNPQKADDSGSASSSKNQNNMSNVYTTQQRKNRNRRRRNRNKDKNGGKEQKRETDPSVATSNTSESTGTFRYDRLFKFSSKKMNGDSGGSNVEEGGAQKSGMSLSTAKEASGTANTTRKDSSLGYNELFSFKEKGHVSGYSDTASSAKDAQKEGVHPPAETELATDTGATSTVKETEEKGSFRYDRLFNFSTRKQNAPEMTDNGARTNKTREEDFFRYDRLFNFSTRKQNAPEKTDNGARTNKTREEDFFRYDRLFNFSRRKQNAPENTDNRARTNKAEEKDFFRYDRLFSFSAGKQNFTDNTDEASISNLMHKCSNCNILEKYPGMYKACRRCLAEGVQAPKVYCGEHCGREYEVHYGVLVVVLNIHVL